jgi:vesicle-fusing ATPase
LDESISLAEYAKRTKNYTGAEIEGIIRSAISFAMQELIDVENLQMMPPEKLRSIRVTQEYFEMALLEVKCEFGSKDEDLALKYNADAVIEFNDEVKDIITEVSRIALSLTKSAETQASAATESGDAVKASGFVINSYALLMKGGIGSGKSALATYLALQTKFPFIRVLSMDDLVGASDYTICMKIAKVFDDAYKSDFSVIIIDDFERLIGYTVGLRFRESIFNTLVTCLRRGPTLAGRRIMTITTADSDVCRELRLDKYFDWIKDMPVIALPMECKEVLIGAGHADKCVPSVDEVVERFPMVSTSFYGIGVGNLLRVCEFAVNDDGEITPDGFDRALRSKIKLHDDRSIAVDF